MARRQAGEVVTWAELRRMVEGEQLCWPDAISRWVMFFGWVPIALWPGDAPPVVVDAWIAAILVLWMWGRWILKPWRVHPED